MSVSDVIRYMGTREFVSIAKDWVFVLNAGLLLVVSSCLRSATAEVLRLQALPGCN